MAYPTSQSRPTTAVAASIGGDYIKFKVFKYLNKIINLDPQLSVVIKNPEDAKPLEDHLHKIAKSAENQRVPLYVTNAAPVEGDKVIFPFFKNPKNKHIDYKNNPYYPYKAIPEMLAKAGLPTDNLITDFGNDTQMNIKFAIKNFREHLKPGDTVYHFISGQGLGGGSAKVSPNYDSVDYLCKEPGHQAMPGLEENLLVEGPARMNRVDAVTDIKGAAEPYCAGGNDNDKDTGPKATIYNLLQLSTSDKAKFQEALILLNKKAGTNITPEIFTASSLINLAQSNKLTTREIGNQAKAGDLLSQAILMFTADRLADFMINLIKTEDRVSESNPLGLISYSSGFAQSLHDNHPPAWTKLQTRLTEALGPGAKLMLCKPEEGFDGTIELAKFALEEPKAEKAPLEKPKVGFFTGIWNWIKSLFGY